MSETMRIVVVGGSAAGAKAAAKARRMNPHADITIVQKAADLSMASCGYPYYVGGVFNDRNDLLSTPTGVVRNPAFFQNAKGITAITGTEVTAIDRDARHVICKNLASGAETTLPYDKLVMATGATAVMPPLPGVDLEGVTAMQTMPDTDRVRAACDSGAVNEAVIIGGGLIGVEACEALHARGIKVTLVELMPQILTFLDWEMAKLVENHIRAQGVDVITGEGATEFLGENGKLRAVKLNDGREIPCQLAVVAVGVRPNVALAKAAGLALGPLGAVEVNEHMQTSDPNIYAAGDCVELKHLVTGKPVLAPLGDLANLAGRVIGANLGGETAAFPGTVQTGVCKVFDYTAGSTGLSERSAREQGYADAVAVVTAAPDKPHYMAPKPLVIKLVADKTSGKLLGMQCVGLGDAAKRIAMAAVAVSGGFTVEDLLNLDLPYAPPYAGPIDNFVTAVHVLENKMAGRMTGLSSSELKRKLDAGEKPFILDLRGPDEFEQMRLGIGETLLPLGKLRQQLDTLPADKNAEIICFCKISLRGYEAACYLEGEGYTNVKVLEGGILAWPYAREK